MSFVPATSQRDALTLLAAVATVAALGLLLRRGMPGPPASGVSGSPPPTGAEDPERGFEPVDTGEIDPLLEEASAEAGEIVAVTSDGWAFVPDEDEVQILPPAPSTDPIAEELGRESIPLDRFTGALEEDPRRRVQPSGKPGIHLDAGDVTGARVVRGAAGTDPWRLETLGRDGEYQSWAFETEDAARAALDLLERRIVRAPLDDRGAPLRPGDPDYQAAFALTQAGVADLATDPADDDTAR
jgi:hypothetical protein